jgi:hypothetical protein
VEDQNLLAALYFGSCYPKNLVGELVNPKSTIKHLFGTGKASQVSLKGEVLFKYIDLTGVGCRRNHMVVRISAVDMFVNSMYGYGWGYNDIDNRLNLIDILNPAPRINRHPNRLDTRMRLSEGAIPLYKGFTVKDGDLIRLDRYPSYQLGAV